jgi:hypothetical protein
MYRMAGAAAPGSTFWSILTQVVDGTFPEP